MEEQLISFDTAKLANGKGFDIKCKNWYDQTGILNPTKGIRGSMFYENLGYAPTQSLLQKWLRETHKIHLTVIHRNSVDGEKEWFDYLLEGSPVTYQKFPSWEMALEEGLCEALKLIK